MRDPGVVRARAPARESPRGAFWSTPMSALSSTLTVRHSPRGNGMSPRSKELTNGGWKPRLCRGASRPPRTYLVLQTPQRLAVRSNEGACFCYAKPQYVPGRMPLPALGGVCPAVLSLAKNSRWSKTPLLTLPRGDLKNVKSRLKIGCRVQSRSLAGTGCRGDPRHATRHAGRPALCSGG